MPAILAKDDWATWLGENGASLQEAKSCFRTVEGIKWTMTKEGRAASKTRREADRQLSWRYLLTQEDGRGAE